MVTSCPYLGDGPAGDPSLSMIYLRPDLVEYNLTPSSVVAVTAPCENDGVATPSISAFEMVGIAHADAVAMADAKKFRLLFVLPNFGCE